MTTLTTDQTHTRQLGFFNPADHPHAHVIFVGVGGIGSWAAFAAAKLGIPNITLIDPDVVEAHNQPSQMYSAHDVGERKVDAAEGMIVGTVEPIPDVRSYEARITENGWTIPDDDCGSDCCDEGKCRGMPPALKGVVVSGLDSMEARLNLWAELKMDPNVSLYLDGRLDGEKIVLYACRPWDLDDIEAYERTLYSDDEAEQGLCTERAVADVGFMMAAIITRAIRLHFADEPVDNVTYINERKLSIMKGPWPEL